MMLKPKDEMFHVLTLDAAQQAALRYCLYNYAQQKIISLLDLKTEEDKEKHGVQMMEIFKQYDTICTLLSPFQGHESFRGTKKLLMYTPSFMKSVVNAVNKYNYSTAEIVLGRDVSGRIHQQMMRLTSLVSDSSLYTYNSDELKKITAK